MQVQIEDLKMCNWKDEFTNALGFESKMTVGRYTSAKDLVEAKLALEQTLERLDDIVVLKQEAYNFLNAFCGATEELCEALGVYDLVNFMDIPAAMFDSPLFLMSKCGRGMAYQETVHHKHHCMLIRAEELLTVSDRWIMTYRSQKQHKSLDAYTVYVILDEFLNRAMSEEERSRFDMIANNIPLGFVVLTANVFDERMGRFTHSLPKVVQNNSFHLPCVLKRPDESLCHIGVSSGPSDMAIRAVNRLDMWMDRLVHGGYISEDESLHLTNRLLAFHKLGAKQEQWFTENTVDYAMEYLHDIFGKKPYSMRRHIYRIINQIKYDDLVTQLTK